jgi:hypothetical protein
MCFLIAAAALAVALLIGAVLDHPSPQGLHRARRAQAHAAAFSAPSSRAS